MTYQEIVTKIKSLEIQGAEKIAIAAVQAFDLKLKETKDKDTIKAAVNELIAQRSTEPALRNALYFCFNQYESDPNIAEKALNHFKESKNIIAEIGAKKIKDGMIVFTHCHSSTVEEICKKAHEQGKKFTVYNTETRPKFQGRITATNIAAAGIPVVHFVDSAAKAYMKEVNLFLFGCDALSAEGKIYNKVGTQALASFALEQNIPAYSCTNSWKFDPQTFNGEEEEIDQRDPNEVWDNPPAGITIRNPAFDVIYPDQVTGVISEIGVVKPETMVLEMQKNCPWMFELKQ